MTPDLEAGKAVSPLQELVTTRKRAAKNKGQSRETHNSILEEPAPLTTTTTPPRIIAQPVSPIQRITSTIKSRASPVSPQKCELRVSVPYETLHAFVNLVETHEWATAAPVIDAAQLEVVNTIIAQNVPTTIYSSPAPKRKHETQEEPQERPSKLHRHHNYNRRTGIVSKGPIFNEKGERVPDRGGRREISDVDSDYDEMPRWEWEEMKTQTEGKSGKEKWAIEKKYKGPPEKRSRVREMMMKKELEKWELEKRREEERREEERKYQETLANTHLHSVESSPSLPNSPSSATSNHEDEIADAVSTTDWPRVQTAQEAVTDSDQGASEPQVISQPLVTPQPTRSWVLGGLTRSVGRLFRFGNPTPLDAALAPASAPHAPTQLLRAEPAPAQSAPSESIPTQTVLTEIAPNESIPAERSPKKATRTESKSAKPAPHVRKSRKERNALARDTTQSTIIAPASSSSLYVATHSDTDSDESLDEQHDEIVKKALAKERAKDLRKFEQHKRRLEFETRKRQESMDQEIEEKVKAQLADKSKKRKHVSPNSIPNPPGVSYGLDLNYFGGASSDEADSDDDLPETPSKRPAKRHRTTPPRLSPPRRQREGTAHSARPYTGNMFAEIPDENIFDPATHRRGGLLPNLDRATERKAEAWDSNPVLSSIPEAHRNYAGSFIVPTLSDDSDDESTMSTTPTGSPSKSAAPNTGSSTETPSGSWTQPPPRAPVPSPAALPKFTPQSATSQPDLLARAREQANRFAPSRPSGLRNASRVSLSTIASEGDREDDQADDAPAASSTETPAAAPTFSLLTEPATISPTEQGTTPTTTDSPFDNTTALVTRPDPDDPETYRTAESALASLDPEVAAAVAALQPEDLAPVSFGDRSWATLPSNNDPTSFHSALAAIGPLDPDVEAALRALKAEDLAQVDFPQNSMTYADAGLVEPIVQQALNEYWTDEDTQNANSAFEADFALWKAEQRGRDSTAAAITTNN